MSIRRVTIRIAAAVGAVALALLLANEVATAQPQPFPSGADRRFLQDYGATRDVYDLIGLRSEAEDSALKAELADSTSTRTPPMSLILIPVIAANPNNGLILGVGGQAGYYLGNRQDTRVSTTQGSATITTKDQLIISTQTTAATSNNDMFVNTDWRYYVFSQSTYGLGTSAPEGSPLSGGWNIGGIPTEPMPGEQPMTFRYLRLHQNLLFEVASPFYVGLGFMYDRHFRIVDTSGLFTDSLIRPTSHQAYSRYYGFDSSAYTLAGFALELSYDGRDSPISAFHGQYARLGYRENRTWLGSDQSSGILWAEYRGFYPLDILFPRHLLAFWSFYHGVVHGNVPYLDLPAIGYDFSGRSGRGYLQGRFRGPQLFYLETEYRFPISEDGLLGGVIFGSLTSASRPAVVIDGQTVAGEDLMFRIRPAAGIGLRLMAQKYSRTSLNVDIGWSDDRQPAIYFSVGEAF